ncbi:anti-sigma regulatory factor (Ser/Thr protein kinase) [Actinoplanes lutulentus]|uniref:Histidine kinase-like protein n=1 Tax=Actinoplanes lutulentus TaxID=1287878 RepID=A0A327Z3B9_9ACTN|nr:ATP-binding protein [Actinoplanes lutulentus]MBB2948799.1 anti-sigma regulatory factor (Ser/Thr protein kinase) [Actinoplanes lutulentus]RAK29711.1 histidine kinase-like protein [Actinoplanes lutulentus]
MKQPSVVWDLIGAYGPDLVELCRAGTALMPGITGIGVSAGPLTAGPLLASQPGNATLLTRFSSDRASARLESAQETLGDGPCRDATATRQPVHAADLNDPSWRARWPRFTPAALDAGARAVFALPLHAGGVRYDGAVDLYRRTPGELPAADQDVAAAFTGAAAELLTLERHGLDWSGAFARARMGQAAMTAAGPADLVRDWTAALPLVRWFDGGALPGLRRRIHTIGIVHGLAGQDAHRLVLAVHEAMINVVHHGGGRGQLLLWQRGGRLWCEVSDHGPGIGTTLRSSSGATDPPRSRNRQRHPTGLELIDQACTSLDITTDGTGTRLRLSHALGS